MEPRSPDIQPAPGIVLDTNVVLDWLLFRDPSCLALDSELEAGRLRWVASTTMRDELAHVLLREPFEPWRHRGAALWAAWERLATTTPPAALSGEALRLRCTDPDDQMFIDLALGHGARWLLSRDRAVLKLARRAAPLGLGIMTPMAWNHRHIPPPE